MASPDTGLVRVFVATFIMVVGVASIAGLSHYGGFRLGGVMTAPLLAIYTFREPLSPLIFVVGTAVAWGALWVTREFTLNHGRRVFLVAISSGVCGTVGAAYVVAFHTPVHLPFDNAEVIGSIFPGIAAYNLMRLEPKNRVADVALSAAVFVGLMILGVAGLLLFEGHPLPTPPILALPESDLIAWLGLETRGEPVTQISPNWLSLMLLVIDVGIYELVRSRYDVRLAGIIVIPLVAVFSLRFEYVVGLFAVGATATYVAVSVIHWLTLLYGRVLLGLSLLLGALYALALGVLIPPLIQSRVPGITLFFLGGFVGIAAYNLYRASPKTRPASLRISAGLFVVFYAILLLFVTVPPEGLFYQREAVYALPGVVAIVFASREVYRLERSRPSPTAFAQASVFANVEVDGGDGHTSPLVDGSQVAGDEETLESESTASDSTADSGAQSTPVSSHPPVDEREPGAPSRKEGEDG
jgi:hypothetical protein